MRHQRRTERPRTRTTLCEDARENFVPDRLRFCRLPSYPETDPHGHNNFQSLLATGSSTVLLSRPLIRTFMVRKEEFSTGCGTRKYTTSIPTPADDLPAYATSEISMSLTRIVTGSLTVKLAASSNRNPSGGIDVYGPKPVPSTPTSSPPRAGFSTVTWPPPARTNDPNGCSVRPLLKRPGALRLIVTIAVVSGFPSQRTVSR